MSKTFAARINYWMLYRIAGVDYNIGRLCGKIGEWFLWQEWKRYTDRKEFDSDIRKLRGIDEIEKYFEDNK